MFCRRDVYAHLVPVKCDNNLAERNNKYESSMNFYYVSIYKLHEQFSSYNC